MTIRFMVRGVFTVFLLSLAGVILWIANLPAPVRAAAEPVTQAEMSALMQSMKPPKRKRPVVAIVGINDATEVTDYILPASILRRADVADVSLLATRPGPVKLFPALSVEPDATIAQFDAGNPEGADYVIVPQMSRADDPQVLGWLRAQAGKGATIIGICAGARIVGQAGLLDNKRGTTHWFYVNELRSATPSVVYVPDRRVVADGSVITTTGITASMPAMLMLIEAIAGRSKAEAVAGDLGLAAWDASHASSRFRLTRPFAITVAGNVLAFWNRERFGLELQPGADEASIALVADAWSRTYRSRAVTFSGTAGAVETRHGVRLIPDERAAAWSEGDRLPAFADRKPAAALDETLRAIAMRYGDRTADVVAMQLEYPR